VGGEFFVDATCINCDTCRQLAPATFDEEDDYSFVYSQPSTQGEIQLAMRAVIACPTGSIGHGELGSRNDAIAEFPLKLDEGLYYTGYHSPKSYGGAAYLVRVDEKNWLVDSPRYSKHLVRRFEELGGIDYIFLTHRDDVADADKYARDFGAQRIIHYADRSAEPDAEIKIKGFDPIDMDGALIIPTPGHTRGHMSLLVGRYLFTGDHLSWRRDWNGLRASRTYNWYSWPKQKESLHLLANYEFEWVLPGHGTRKQLPVNEMRRELSILLDKIASPSYR
ncbi:MAG: MBL fold metallo-hydrolase, partial [Candidatus Kariarchaeaceae archaeon]|jgi:glyoxylase-like metal-dependent hydrolase (beta-lactamase superfamily II)/ferredoxin